LHSVEAPKIIRTDRLAENLTEIHQYRFYEFAIWQKRADQYLILEQIILRFLKIIHNAGQTRIFANTGLNYLSDSVF